MRNQTWVVLVKYLSPEVQPRLMLVTVGGQEISMQSILRIEQDFMVVKGRLSGSQDAGRVFFVPYAQIDYLGFQNPVKDEEFNEIFRNLVLPEGAEDPLPIPTATSTGTSDPGLTPATPAGSSPASYSSLPRPNGSGPRPAIKSVVLERFRARNSAISEPTTPPARPGESS